MASYKPNAGPAENLKKLLREQNADGVSNGDFNGSEPTEVLTAKAVFNADARASSNGTPEAQLLKTASVTLTDAQIKALPSSSVTLVAAIAGKVIVPVIATWRLDASAGVYTADADSSWQLQMGAFPNAVAISSIAAIQSKLQSADPSFGAFSPQTYTDTPFGTIGVGFDDSLINFENLPLTIGDYYTGVSNYTGGNASNTLKVTVWYVEVDA